MKHTTRITLAVVSLAAVCAIAAGCSQLKEGSDWLFFPNETAIRKDWDQEQDLAGKMRDEMQKEMQAVAESQRASLADLAARRIGIDQEFEKKKIDYSAESAILDLEESAVVTLARTTLDSIDARLVEFDDRMSQRRANFDDRLAQAKRTDTLLWSAGLGLLGLTGGVGGTGALALGKIRRRVAEARDEQGQISVEEGFGVGWDSIEIIREMYPEFDDMWRNNPQYGAAASKVLEAAGEQYVMLAKDKKRARTLANSVVNTADTLQTRTGS